MQIVPQKQGIAKIWKKIKGAVPKYKWLRTMYLRMRAVSELPSVWKTQRNYEKKRRELSKNKERIKVVFLVAESTKWNGDSLYKLLEKDSRFSPIIVYIPLHTRINTDQTDDFHCQFFEARGYNFAAISSGAKVRDYKPDIVFYQQPWLLEMEPDLNPMNVSQHALCLYFHYGIVAASENLDDYSLFIKTLYRYFVFNATVKEHLKTKDIHNTIVTGHPKMDAYLEPVKTCPWKDERKFKIVYAPHHSFKSSFLRLQLQWATFDWNGRELLEWAKAHTNTEWILKPHSHFRAAVIRNEIMNEAEIEEYYNEWNKVGAIYNQGDYFDIFRTADLLITDCGSFLTEWLPTGKPCIHLLTENEAQKNRSLVHENSSRHYYKVKNIEELEATMEMLVVRREDPLAKARIQDAKTVPLDCAKNIYQWLVETIWGEKREAESQS